MNAMKLHEVISEMEAERQKLTVGIDALRALLPVSADGKQITTTFAPEAEKPSYIDDSEELIREAGHPLHAKVLAEKISDKRGVPVARSSVESSVIRHIAKAKNPKLAKMGRSTFGLPEWKQQSLQPSLVNVA